MVRAMANLDLLPDAAVYILLGAVIISRLPRFGRDLLAFLRDLHNYREG
jgi:hypothetical protein